MTNYDWNNKAWDTLIHTINQGDCILMLGPDCANEQINGKLKPLTEILAKQLAEKIRSKIDSFGIDDSNLAQVTQYYVTEVKRNGLEAKVNSFYKERINLTDEFHKNLSVLPFYLCISSSPDQMYYNALKDAQKEPIIKWYNFQGESHSMVKMGTSKEPLLFYLYGAINEPSSLVLTENDILDFLVAVVSKTPTLPKNILSELHDIKKSFLFLGFGFKHWYLRILLHVLQGNKKQVLSFAFEQYPQKEVEFKRAILFFKENSCEIRIYDGELRSFVKELRQRYEASTKYDHKQAQTKAFNEQPVEDALTIFICHASENKDYASFLYDKLEAAGFKPWLDRENLRGGDQWDDAIQKIIAKEIDYFVVLQSSELAQKIEGYVNKEINLALERHKKVKRGFCFIIPVKIQEECTLLEELEQLQTIDLSNEANFEKLVNTIRRDQMKRKGENR